MRKTALLFAGQGAQFVGMGRDLAGYSRTAGSLFANANEILGYDLASICFEGPEPELTKTEHAQPGIFLVSWVAFKLLEERCPGFTFQATAGLSLGEFTALAAARGIDFATGLKVVRERGRAMQEACDAAKGGMAAVIGLDETATRAVCDKAGVALANLNCPGQIVISGALERLTLACEMAKTAGAKRALPLTVAGAYHSPLMASAQPKLHAALANGGLRSAAVPVISNVTARPHQALEEIRSRLVEQVTAPVRWEDSMRFLLAEGFTRFIELGPGTALSGFLRRIDKQAEVLCVGDRASLEKAVQVLAA